MVRNPQLLARAFNAWLAASDMRRARRRHLRYTYGDQWCDLVDDHTGNIVTERSLLVKSGRSPQTNNLIRQLVKTIVGRYRNLADEGAFYDNTPGSVDSRNRMAELDSRLLEEFVISGCAVQRVCAERRPGGDGVWVDNVDPDAFFVNSYRDPRGFDIDFIGMLHDMSLPEVINRFAGGSRRRADALRSLYGSSIDENADMLQPDTPVGVATPAGIDFYRPRSGRCRVIEVWQLVGRPVTDASGRLRMDMRWISTWLAPDGTVLLGEPSPWPHGSHPFVVKMYPLTDGQVHSFVEDVIDQQRTINRLVVLIDSMLASSAKGVLLYPVDQIPKGMKFDDVASMWANPNAVIPVAGQGREFPRQMVNNSADSGAYQLLNLQMKLFEDISGISDALLGRNVSASTGQALYDAQVRQAAVSLTDLLASFASFTDERRAKADAILA